MGVSQDFRALVDRPETTYAEVRAFLDKLSADERAEAIRAMGGRRRQARLYALAQAGGDFGLDEIVPKGRGALDPVIFYGKNSLPLFTIFQKRFCRPTRGADTLLGYNHQANSWITGPGYFTVRASQDAKERELGPVAIDYTRLPDEKPESWPAIKGNGGGLSRLVYYDMVDYLRALSDHVYIGRAVKSGKITDNYFLLAQERVD